MNSCISNAKTTNSSFLLQQLLSNQSRTLEGVLDTMPRNKTVVDNMIIAWSKLNSPLYNKICCSISGGSDSDLLIDICARCDIHHKVDYVWFNTGLEYQATKEHLDDLERKYGIVIQRHNAIKSIPKSCKEYGQPFVSKMVSEFMSRLQKHGFQWEDEDFITLLNRYCKVADENKAKQLEEKVSKGKKSKPWAKIEGKWYTGCVSALAWWCNAKELVNGKSQFNNSRNPYLKEFIMANPPKQKISNKCCKYAKKDVAKKLINKMGYELMIVGVRKAEGGQRATAYKNCFTHREDKCDEYRPIFFYSNMDKEEYVTHTGIIHSQCYRQYGLCRTGCVGCPYGQMLKQELSVCEQYEPKLYTAVTNVFGWSYNYTNDYHLYQKKMRKVKLKNKVEKSDERTEISKEYSQMTIFDFISA